jgi:flagellar biosynthetic protein FliR
MEALISLIDQPTVLSFLLLLARILSFMAFMPIVGHKSVNPTIRIAISFYFAIFLFPYIDYLNSNLTNDQFILALLSEITLGLVASF